MSEALLDIDLNDEDQLDISQEELEIKQYSDTLIDLQNILNEIEKQASVNKTLAIAIESACPGTLSDKTPVNSFTAENSKINLTSSTEDLIDGIIATIKNIFKAIAKVIDKVLEFIKRVISRVKAKQKVYSENIAAAKVLADEIFDLKTRFTGNDVKIYDSVFSEIASSGNEDLKNMCTDLFRDIYDAGNIRSTTLAIARDFSGYIDKSNSKLILLEKAMNEAKSIDTPRVIKLISEVNMYIKNASSDHYLAAINGANGTIANDIPNFKNYVLKQSEIKSKTPVNYQILFADLRNDKLIIDDSFLTDEKHIEQNIETMKARKDKLSSRMDSEIKTSLEILELLKESRRVLTEELQALSDFSQIYYNIYNVSEKLSDFTYRTVNAHYKRLITEARGASNEATRNAAKESYHKDK